MKAALPYVGAVIAILGILFKAGQLWGDLTARVTVLENTTTYYHGAPIKE